MKKFITSTLFTLIAVLTFGQLNPVNDFAFEHWYSFGSVCPGFNCFSLNWDEPDVSIQDTLIGYNIYRDSELWRFQDYQGAGCGEATPQCPDADFFNFPEPFWVKVKAVYNVTLLESPAVDSAQFLGLMMGTELIQKENEILYPNPTTGIINIDIENFLKIIVVNNVGKLIYVGTDKSIIDLSGYSKGIYYFKIITDKGVKTEKVVIE
nr:T9SS type A sorting domain-containing protein [Bacteroidota bacterium]